MRSSPKVQTCECIFVHSSNAARTHSRDIVSLAYIDIDLNAIFMFVWGDTVVVFVGPVSVQSNALRVHRELKM